MAELVDAPDLGSGAARRGGSSPFTRTILKKLNNLSLLEPDSSPVGAADLRLRSRCGCSAHQISPLGDLVGIVSSFVGRSLLVLARITKSCAFPKEPHAWRPQGLAPWSFEAQPIHRTKHASGPLSRRAPREPTGKGSSQGRADRLSKPELQPRTGLWPICGGHRSFDKVGMVGDERLELPTSSV